ncbi:MAG: PEP-CTERM sorting domain-containing protein [Phycisphaeraceae bacterium]
MQRMLLSTVCTLALVLPASPAPASVDDGHTHDGDFGLHVEAGDIHAHPRVIGGLLGAEQDDSSTAPGFDAEPGTFPDGSAVGFDILEPLGLWNGDGFDPLDPATDEVLAITYVFGLDIERRDTAGGFVTGFDVPVAGDGSWHQHLTWTLLGDGGSLTGVPDAGVYLLTLQLRSSAEEIGPSEPLYLVFDSDAGEAAHEAAIDWTRTNLIPEPASLAVLGLGAGLLLTRRRQAG